MGISEYEKIIGEIENGLTGDRAADMKYLLVQMEKYKKHEYGSEIVKACGRLLYNVMPDEMKNDYANASAKDDEILNKNLEEARRCVAKKDLRSALKFMEPVIERLDNEPVFREDKINEYRDFQEPFELLLYLQINNPQKAVRPTTRKYAESYYLYGSLLYEFGRSYEAEKYLEKAMGWNPTSAKIAFEYAEICKLGGKLDEYYGVTRNTFKFAFRPEDLARCYRNLGYYYIEKNQYQIAVCCELFSLQFGKSSIVQNEIQYILSKGAPVNIEPDNNFLRNCFKYNDIPYGPDKDMLLLAYRHAKKSIEDKQKGMAEYFVNIDRAFVQDETINGLYEEIQRM